MIWPRRAVVAAALVLAAACGGSPGSPSSGGALAVVVSAPVSTDPWIATEMVDGARLAAQQLAAGHGGQHVDVQVMDNAGSASAVVAAAKRAVGEHALALVIDGVGATDAAAVTDPAGLPVFVVYDGGPGLVDAARFPTLFRMAPADDTMAVRLTDYLAGRHPRLGVITDTSSYGQGGRQALTPAIRRDGLATVSSATVPADAADVAAQVLAARTAGATELVVWAGAPVVAETVADARAAGWTVPIWSGPAAEDPLVRQRLAGHPGWLDGVGFVSFRITAEVGPAPFERYRAAYVRAFGVRSAGVEQGGRPVLVLPDWSMFASDSVRLAAAAERQAGSTGHKELAALEAGVVVAGANGDERGFSGDNREGVSPDDMYFATFHGNVFAPVTDDPLSTSLPAVPQT